MTLISFAGLELCTNAILMTYGLKQMRLFIFTYDECINSKYFPSGPMLFVSLELLLLMLVPLGISSICCGFTTPLTTVERASCLARTCRRY